MARKVDGVPESIQDAAIDVRASSLLQFLIEFFWIDALQVADAANTDRLEHCREVVSDPWDGLEFF